MSNDRDDQDNSDNLAGPLPLQNSTTVPKESLLDIARLTNILGGLLQPFSRAARLRVLRDLIEAAEQDDPFVAAIITSDLEDNEEELWVTAMPEGTS